MVTLMWMVFVTGLQHCLRTCLQYLNYLIHFHWKIIIYICTHKYIYKWNILIYIYIYTYDDKSNIAVSFCSLEMSNITVEYWFSFEVEL